MSEGDEWFSALLKSVPQQPQTQEQLRSQLLKLRALSVRFGLYDACDFLDNLMGR